MSERMGAKIDKRERVYSQELDAVTAYLADEQKRIGVRRIEQGPRECHLKRTLTPEKLQTLHALRFEVMISDHNNGLSLYTGQKGATEPLNLTSSFPKHDMEGKMRTDKEARFTLHNHPNYTSSPSAGDFHASGSRNSEVDFILGKDGITFHKSKDIFDVTAVDFQVTRDMRRKYFPQSVINRDLKKGRINGFIPWGDPRLHLVCEYMNNEHATWADYEKRLQNKK
ncbi:MAG: hypothetical protein RI911_801 [Candidatus Parcubacteria bacterium]|jgi:hypothetical protein